MKRSPLRVRAYVALHARTAGFRCDKRQFVHADRSPKTVGTREWKRLRQLNSEHGRLRSGPAADRCPSDRRLLAHGPSRAANAALDYSRRQSRTIPVRDVAARKDPDKSAALLRRVHRFRRHHTLREVCRRTDRSSTVRLARLGVAFNQCGLINETKIVK